MMIVFVLVACLFQLINRVFFCAFKFLKNEFLNVIFLVFLLLRSLIC
jgi:hypothetical protein